MSTAQESFGHHDTISLDEDTFDIESNHKTKRSSLMQVRSKKICKSSKTSKRDLQLAASKGRKTKEQMK